ncbi:hypothetical protein BRC19_00790 [Candidatus Saccharibacteria bacterium QS_5_54_17]|nr:MAG: hypothetical protein BRC19_00790 [Candidatus Saccharibacteria bacterium QS_5_54_17]
MACKIDFVIAGQPKSGTTALAHFLSEHPEICMSYPKEPSYFATDLREESDQFHGKQRYYGVRTPEKYEEHFKHCQPGQLRGDASTCYSYSQAAAGHIYQHNPKAKIIIMLRNPVDFMHSLHTQYVNETVENETDFQTAISLESSRKKGKNVPPRARCPSYHFYRERARYSKHIQRFYDQFGKENVMVIANEEFKKNNETAYKEILRFLGVREDVIPDFQSVHNSKKPRISWLNKIAHTMWLKNVAFKLMSPTLYTNLQKQADKLLLKEQSKGELDPEVRKRLTEELRPEVRELSRLTNQDFAAIWGFEEN